jgi:hypothetical protein
MFMIHTTLSNKMKLKKLQNPFIKSPFLNLVMFFFPKKDIIMHLLLNTCLKI